MHDWVKSQISKVQVQVESQVSGVWVRLAGVHVSLNCGLSLWSGWQVYGVFIVWEASPTWIASLWAASKGIKSWVAGVQVWAESQVAGVQVSSLYMWAQVVPWVSVLWAFVLWVSSWVTDSIPDLHMDVQGFLRELASPSSVQCTRTVYLCPCPLSVA